MIAWASNILYIAIRISHSPSLYAILMCCWQPSSHHFCWPYWERLWHFEFQPLKVIEMCHKTSDLMWNCVLALLWYCTLCGIQWVTFWELNCICYILIVSVTVEEQLEPGSQGQHFIARSSHGPSVQPKIVSTKRSRYICVSGHSTTNLVGLLSQTFNLGQGLNFIDPVPTVCWGILHMHTYVGHWTF